MAMHLQSVVITSKTCLTDAEWRANGKPHMNTWHLYYIDEQGRRRNIPIRDVPGNQKLRTRIQLTYGFVDKVYISVGHITEEIKVKNPWSMTIK